MIRVAGIALVLGASLACASAPWQQGDVAAADISDCGHLGQMEAGKRALAAGDREAALTHLRAARAMLRQCEGRTQAADLGVLEI